MKRLNIFTWHIHGSYLYYLSQIPHEIFIPKKLSADQGYIGITSSYSWPSNIHEIPADEVKNYEFDCILFQSHRNYLQDQYEVLSGEQLKLPKVHLEHDPPRESPTDTFHPIDDPNVVIVHVTDYNKLMWDCRRTPTTSIDHGVLIPHDVTYQGDLKKGIVVVNNIHKRGRRLGYDIFNQARQELDLDLYGMGWKQAGGVGEVSHRDLPVVSSRYRYFYNPIRHSSLGLSICEAMMLGMPIVGLATAELATVIDNGVSGYISTRPHELIEVCKELIANEKLARIWGQGARKKAIERFSIQRFVNDWNKILQDVVGRHATSKHPVTYGKIEEASWTSP